MVRVKNLLQVDNVSTYIGHTEIVKEATFDIKQGEIVGLVGPNGAGKTTIMKTILGLTKFTGKIAVDNEQVTENNHVALAKVGALIEHPAIYPFLTGQENLELYAHSKDDIVQVVAALQMDSYIKKV